MTVHRVTAREVRHTRLQAVGNAGMPQGAVPDAVWRGTFGRRGKAVNSSYCRPRHVPGPSDTLRQLLRYRPTGEGSVQALKNVYGAAKYIPWYLA